MSEEGGFKEIEAGLEGGCNLIEDVEGFATVLLDVEDRVSPFVELIEETVCERGFVAGFLLAISFFAADPLRFAFA